MSQQEAVCFVCQQKIYIHKPTPDSKWIKTNLDGSAHVDAKKDREKSTTATITPTTDEKKGWETAHDENMDSQDRIIKALDNVSTKLEYLKDLQHSIDNLAASNTHLTAAAASIGENVKHFSLAIQEYLQVANPGNRS